MNAVILVFILLQVLELTAAVEPAVCGSVSLKDNDHDWYGIVTVGAISDNNMICSSSWNSDTARVICRQLGYAGVIDHTPVPVPGGAMGYSGIVCQGSESSLCDCDCGNSVVTTCPEGSVGRVACQVGEELYGLELAGGNYRWEGTAVLTVNGVRGTLCSDSANIDVASVICKELGFSRALHYFIRSQYESSVEGDLKWLGSIDCDGNEEAILLCSHSGIGQVELCDTQKNLGIVCDGGLLVDKVPVRLTGGTDKDGIVEVFYTGIWGTICNRDWTWMDANVVCTQLGHGPLVEMTRADDYNSTQASDVILTTGNAGCNGSEQYLTQCESINWGFTDCTAVDAVGVKCSELEPLLNYIRLVDGESDIFKNVEILMNGVWGRVCANDWDDDDGDVVCRQLGFSRVNEVSHSQTSVDGTQVAWIDDVICDGSENELRHCPHTRKHNGICDDGMVAAIICNSKPRAGSVRLIGGQSREEGAIDIFESDEWKPVCGDGWGRLNGDIVCRELGYLRSFTAGVITLSIQQRSATIDCAGDESSLSDCSLSSKSGCMTYASVVCTDEPEISVRLQDGSTGAAGRVEVFYKDTWGTICDSNWNIANGEVVCRQLGFSGVHEGIQIGTYPANECTPIWLTDVQCEGSETMLSECNLELYGSQQCLPGHSNDAAVMCIVDEDSSTIRLVGGTASSEGRLELFHNGAWGSICNDMFGMPDGIVACRQLGFTGFIEEGREGEYGVSKGPILLTNVDCNGNEASLDECSSMAATDCAHKEDVGIVCNTKSGVEGDIRLLSSDLSQPTSGGVEIFHDNFWGGVCDNSWLHRDAEVVCRQLGFLGGTAYEPPLQEKKSTVGWLRSVDCNGTEERFEDCSLGGWRLDGVCFIVEVICEVPPEPTPTPSQPKISSSRLHVTNPTSTYDMTTSQTTDPIPSHSMSNTTPSTPPLSSPVTAVAGAVAAAVVVLVITILLVILLVTSLRRRARAGRRLVSDFSTSTEEGGEKKKTPGITNQLFDVSVSVEHSMPELGPPQTLSLKTDPHDTEGHYNDPRAPTPTYHTEVSM